MDEGVCGGLGCGVETPRIWWTQEGTLDRETEVCTGLCHQLAVSFGKEGATDELQNSCWRGQELGPLKPSHSPLPCHRWRQRAQVHQQRLAWCAWEGGCCHGWPDLHLRLSTSLLLGQEAKIQTSQSQTLPLPPWSWPQPQPELPAALPFLPFHLVDLVLQRGEWAGSLQL